MKHEHSTELEVELSRSLFAERPAVSLSWHDDAGDRRVQIEGNRLLIGSAADAAVQINDRRASRMHAELRIELDGAWIRDLASKNGTWVDGVRVVEACLPSPQCNLRIGGVEVQANISGSRVRLWPDDSFGPLVGGSDAMRALLLEIAELARSDATVLILGETGTGKELVARQLHDSSARASRPFVVVDCGSLPEGLIEAELFGAAKGAYTGSDTDRVGAIESAQGGTVFLDEVGELPLSVQPRLLRVMESKTIRRLGETAHRDVDVRFVAATHRDLTQMSAENLFREDLYFRLAVLALRVPALRQRLDDIPLLLKSFLKVQPKLRDSDLKALKSHPWPGNVRQLKNFATRLEVLGIERALERLSEKSEPATALDANAALTVNTEVPFKTLREHWVSHLERNYLKALIDQHGRNSAHLAEAAELDRSYIHRLLKKHAL